MTTYTDPFTGQTISPSQVGYESLTISTNTYLQWPINGNTADVVANIIDIDPTVSGLFVYLPTALQVSVGQSVLIRNTGAVPFTVATVNGLTIASINSGIAEYIYLTNNTTADGTWASVTFGAGTNSANASALAGAGLLAIGATLNLAYNVSTLYSSVSVNSSNRAQFLVWEGGVGAITLPSSATLGNNWFIIVRNNGSGILTLTPSGTDTIDGNMTQQLQLSNSLVIVSNGSTGFNTFGLGQSALFAFTQLALNVTGGTYTLTSVQAANVIQEYSGTLTSNQTIVLPSTVQLYSLLNNTTGAFTLTFTTSVAGGMTVAIPQGEALIVVCDGTNVYNASSGVASSFNQITVNPGSASQPAINFSGNLNTGFYLPSTGQIGFSLLGNNAMTLESDGLHVVNGIGGGAF